MDQISWSTHVLETYIFSSSFSEVISRLEQVVSKKSALLGVYINAVSVDFETDAEIENLFSLHSSSDSLMLNKALNPIIISEIWRNKIFYVSHDNESKKIQVHDFHQQKFQSNWVTLNIPIGRTQFGQYLFVEISFGARHEVERDCQVKMLALDEIEFIQKFFLTICRQGFDTFDVLDNQSLDQSQGTQPFKEKYQDGRYRLLSERQLKIADLLNSGYTNQEIARALHVSVATVKLEVSKIIKIFGISSRKDIPG